MKVCTMPVNFGLSSEPMAYLNKMSSKLAAANVLKRWGQLTHNYGCCCACQITPLPPEPLGKGTLAFRASSLGRSL